MGLINNCIRTQWAGIAEGSAHALLPGNWNSYRQHEKDIVPDGASAVLNTRSSPSGYRNPFCHHPPLKDGEISWGPTGTGDLDLSVLMSRSLVFDFTASGDLDLSISQAAAMAFAMTGSGTLTCSLPGRASMSFDFTGSGDLEADLKGLANMVFDFEATGDLDTTLKAFGNMSFDIVVTGTGLTFENLGPALMNAIAETGPDGTYTLAEILRIIASRSAGLNSGGPDSPAFKAITDATKTRIEGTADSNGNRTGVTLDPSDDS